MAVALDSFVIIATIMTDTFICILYEIMKHPIFTE